MPAFLITTSRDVSFWQDDPTVDQITRLFLAAEHAVHTDSRFASAPAVPPTATNPNSAPPQGRWIGPQPRVTRLVNAPALPAFWLIGPTTLALSSTHVTAAWLYEWPDDDAWVTAHLPVMRQVLLASLASQLAADSSDWSEPSEQPYAPALHGSLECWRSGKAAQSETRDRPLGLAERVAVPAENPIACGIKPRPTTLETALRTGERTVSIWDRANRNALPLVAIALLIGGAVYFWPNVKAARRISSRSRGIRKRTSTSATRDNPQPRQQAKRPTTKQRRRRGARRNGPIEISARLASAMQRRGMTTLEQLLQAAFADDRTRGAAVLVALDAAMDDPRTIVLAELSPTAPRDRRLQLTAGRISDSTTSATLESAGFSLSTYDGQQWWGLAMPMPPA